MNSVLSTVWPSPPDWRLIFYFAALLTVLALVFHN
jgi:hypothetical protein